MDSTDSGRPTAEDQNHGRVVLSLMQELALERTALRHGNPTERVVNFSCHEFCVVWNKEIEATRFGRLFPTAGDIQDTWPSTPPWVPEHRKKIKYGHRWKSNPSVLRYERRTRNHKSFHRLPATTWCKIGRKIRNRGFPFWLVSFQSRAHGSSQAPFRCSNGPRTLCSSLSVLCLLVTL